MKSLQGISGELEDVRSDAIVVEDIAGNYDAIDGFTPGKLSNLAHGLEALRARAPARLTGYEVELQA